MQLLVMTGSWAVTTRGLELGWGTDYWSSRNREARLLEGPSAQILIRPKMKMGVVMDRDMVGQELKFSKNEGECSINCICKLLISGI